MRKFAFCLCLLVALPLWAQDPIGKVVDLVGDVSITHPSAKAAKVIFQQSVYLGDEIKTKADGGVKILFIDDTLLTIKENSKVLVTEFLFDAEKRQRKVKFESPLGRIRAVVGQFFGKDQPVEIKTPTAVAGIRGTDLGLKIEPVKTTLYCFEHCLKIVETYNIEFPKQIVKLDTGQAIEILRGLPALSDNVIPIPPDILDNKGTLFDVQSGAQDKSVNSASEESAKASAETKPTEEKTQENLLDTASAAQTAESTTQNQTPTTVNTQTEVVPGGASKVTGGAAVTITLPK